MRCPVKCRINYILCGDSMSGQYQFLIISTDLDEAAVCLRTNIMSRQNYYFPVGQGGLISLLKEQLTLFFFKFFFLSTIPQIFLPCHEFAQALTLIWKSNQSNSQTLLVSKSPHLQAPVRASPISILAWVLVAVPLSPGPSGMGKLDIQVIPVQVVKEKVV